MKIQISRLEAINAWKSLNQKIIDSVGVECVVEIHDSPNDIVSGLHSLTRAGGGEYSVPKTLTTLHQYRTQTIPSVGGVIPTTNTDLNNIN